LASRSSTFSICFECFYNLSMRRELILRPTLHYSALFSKGLKEFAVDEFRIFKWMASKERVPNGEVAAKMSVCAYAAQVSSP